MFISVMFFFSFQIDEIDLNEQLTEMPFASYQLLALILSNAKLRKHFSSNAVAIFSSNVFKNVTIQFIKNTLLLPIMKLY